MLSQNVQNLNQSLSKFLLWHTDSIDKTSLVIYTQNQPFINLHSGCMAKTKACIIFKNQEVGNKGGFSNTLALCSLKMFHDFINNASSRELCNKYIGGRNKKKEVRTPPRLGKEFFFSTMPMSL